MKQLGRRFLAIIACVAMVFSMLPQSGVAYAADADTAAAYEIYPTPHSVEYKDGSFVIRSNVNVVFESDIDEYTKDKMEEVLENKGITMSESAKMSDSTTNILVGIKDSAEYVDAYADENLTYSEDTYADNHYDAYVLDVNDGTITILGDTTDAAFYGIVSLMHILNQLDGKTIRNLTIEDYADTAIRGFIEGYYGVPWSNEDRMSLMEFGGQFKMTSYIFAPKDDPYHTSYWRQLYPQAEIDAIAEMVEVGNANKCRFVWTAHPFMGGFNANDVAGETASLLAKFEQLYSVGVRQFGVLGDDVGNLNRSAVIQVMTAVSEWAEQKGDVYDTVFCPAGYNHAWQGDYSELNDYDAGFPDDVQIFWTGQAVCQPVEQLTLNNFRNLNARNGQRRSPLFWLNWPVNDINMSRLMMGKGSLLHTDVKVEDLAGVVTNPMQDAEASKVALFAVADYSWNVADFDDDKSWADSFAYIDVDASEELYTLAKHMSDPSPNGHGLNLAESEELSPLLDAYKTKVENGTATEADHAAIIKEFEIIAEACDAFHQKSENAKLKEELLPFTNSLKDQALAAIAFVNTQKAIDAGNASEVWSNYSQATTLLASSKTHMRVTLTGVKEALPGSKHVTPFVESLSTLLSPIVNSMIDETKIIATFITSRTDTPSGNVDNIMDGDVASSAIYQSPNVIYAGDYVGVKYTSSIKVNSIRFVLGAGKDHFDQGKLQYTVDGKEWQDIALVGMQNLFNGVRNQVQDIAVEEANLPENFEAMGIRFIATIDNEADAWLEVREVMINGGSKEETENPAIAATLQVPSEYGVYEGSVNNVFDGSDSTYVWYRTPNNTCAVGDCLTLDLGADVTLGTIHFAMPSGDCLSNYTLQYSVNGTNYTDIETFTTLTADVDLNGENITARYVRVRNNVSTGKWLKVAEFSVSEKADRADAIFTNKNGLTGLSVEMVSDTATIRGSKSITFAPGEYVGIALDRIKDITNITTSEKGGLTLESSKNNVIWSEVGATYEDARYVRLINNTNSDVTINFSNLTVESFELEPISVEATNFGDAGTHLKAFDNDRTTEAVLQASQYAGYYITYDLGQVIELDSLKLVLHDGTTDYPRHAKVSVSENGTAWTPVMLIGNQDSANEGEAENTDNISELFPVHEISYYTLEETDIDENVRYIKFEITRNKAGADKWVRIREIELNGGNMYMASENNPTIVTSGTESNGNAKTSMIDGDVSTTFKSVDDAAGSFTYYISENTRIKKINILQSPAILSEAKVSAEVVRNGNVETVEIGHLMSSMNEFNTSAFDHVLSITVEWEAGMVPEIYEIITSTSSSSVGAVDKTELQNYYNSVKDTNTSTWTDNSKAAFAEAIALAEYALENSYVTSSGVNSALAELTAAVEGKIVKPNMASFEAAVTAATKDVQVETDYLARTWKVYAEVMAEVESVKADAEVSQAELDAVLAALNDAVEGLVYEVASIEELEVLAADAKAQYPAEDYTEEAFAALTAAIEAAEEMVAADAVERQNPVEVRACLEALNTAIDNLDSTEPSENPFEDVYDTDYYYDPVMWAVEEGITDGWTPTTFAPDMGCTRGQVVTFLWRAAGEPEAENAENPFTDVAENAYYYDAVLWAVEEGITDGWTATTFAPDMTCTRGQIVTFIWRAAGELEATGENPFIDVTENAYYYNAVLWAVENGITDGWTATEFAPEMECTRGQVVTFLYRHYN